MPIIPNRSSEVHVDVTPNSMSRLRDEANGIGIGFDCLSSEFDSLSPQEQAEEIYELWKRVDAFKQKVDSAYTNAAETQQNWEKNS